jgi:hypothetical protein
MYETLCARVCEYTEYPIPYVFIFLCLSMYTVFIFRVSAKLIGHQRSWERVYDIGFKAVEIFLIYMWWKLQINQSWKSIELLLYRIKYTKAYVILSLMHRSGHNKLNKIGLVFLWFLCDFIWFLRGLWF